MKVSTIKYLQKVIDEFLEELRGMSATLAAYHLVQIRGGVISRVIRGRQGVNIPPRGGAVFINEYKVQEVHSSIGSIYY